MRVFVVGATGFVGNAIAHELRVRGHAVAGMSRTVESAEQLRANGHEPIEADLDERLDEALAAAGGADAVVYAAQIAPDREATVVHAFLDALSGTGKTFVFVSGTGVLMQRTAGAWSEDSFAEDDAFDPEPLALDRVHTEVAVRAAAASGVRTAVVRLPYLWGDGEHGHLSATYESVAITGSACYVGDGLACYTNLHVTDAARLVAAALKDGRTGALYQGAAGEIANRWIAEAVARDLNCAARSITPDEAADTWGEFNGLIMGASSRCRSPRSRHELGWRPVHTDMLTAIGAPHLRAIAAR